jgi:hypothetical protein
MGGELGFAIFRAKKGGVKKADQALSRSCFDTTLAMQAGR